MESRKMTKNMMGFLIMNYMKTMMEYMKTMMEYMQKLRKRRSWRMFDFFQHLLGGLSSAVSFLNRNQPHNIACHPEFYNQIQERYHKSCI